MSVKSFLSIPALAAVTGLAATSALAQVTIPTVTIGNPGNAPDPLTGNFYGSVAYTYNIGTTEVTNAQYAAFLNAKAATDTYSLYNPNMAGTFGGITRSPGSGPFNYATVPGRENNPVNFVSFWDATRFANWLHNGQGSGDTETGAYTLGGVTNPVNASVNRIAGWQWAVTSEDEWYKAAYHQPASQGGDADNYWLYPTSTDTIKPSMANYSGIEDTVPVGSYASNANGTFDMCGNVSEWNEAIGGDSVRGIRGGSFGFDGSKATDRFDEPPIGEFNNLGFRVVQVPGSPSLLVLGVAALRTIRRKRLVSR
jgi:sulfatase modifying factor 1